MSGKPLNTGLFINKVNTFISELNKSNEKSKQLVQSITFLVDLVIVNLFKHYIQIVYILLN